MLPVTPDGVPYLMQNQHLAFTGDVHLAAEFLRLRDKYGVKLVVETGTYIGTTALWLAQHFEQVITTEVAEPFYNTARIRAEGLNNLMCIHGPGSNTLRRMKDDYLGWIDAHPMDATGNGYDVVIQELEAIAESGIKPCALVLHDFQVPGHPELQFDRFDGNPFTYEWIEPSLIRIYGEGGFTHYFNSEATGAKVGVLFVERV